MRPGSIETPGCF